MTRAPPLTTQLTTRVDRRASAAVRFGGRHHPAGLDPEGIHRVVHADQRGAVGHRPQGHRCEAHQCSRRRRQDGVTQPRPGQLAASPRQEQDDGGEDRHVAHVLLHQQRGHQERPGQSGRPGGPVVTEPVTGLVTGLVDRGEDRDQAAHHERRREQLPVDGLGPQQRTDTQGAGHQRSPGRRSRSAEATRGVCRPEDHCDRGQAADQPQRHQAPELGRDPEDADQQGGPVHPVVAVERGAAGVPLLADHEEPGLVAGRVARQEGKSGHHGGQRDERDGVPSDEGERPSWSRRSRDRCRSLSGDPCRTAPGSSDGGGHVPRLRLFT